MEGERGEKRGQQGMDEIQIPEIAVAGAWRQGMWRCHRWNRRLLWKEEADLYVMVKVKI